MHFSEDEINSLTKENLEMFRRCIGEENAKRVIPRPPSPKGELLPDDVVLGVLRSGPYHLVEKLRELHRKAKEHSNWSEDNAAE